MIYESEMGGGGVGLQISELFTKNNPMRSLFMSIWFTSEAKYWSFLAL